AGAVALGLTSIAGVRAAIECIVHEVRRYDADALSDRFLVERMIGDPLAQLLVNVRAEPGFGYAMTIASGGVFTELLVDSTTLLLPASEADFEAALATLRISRLLGGFRGRAVADRARIVEMLARLSAYVCNGAGDITEIEINPLFVLPDRVCAVDVLMRVKG
ncbi:MAG: acetate--CoA ligase family protein, partial [Gammaproteobacteria bacterium]